MYELIRKHTDDKNESLFGTFSTLEEAKSELRKSIAELPLNYIVMFSDRNTRADVWMPTQNNKRDYLMAFYIEKVGQRSGWKGV